MSKKAKCPAFENHERWLVSFADMMTLLFALFVVLFALKDSSESESENIEQAAGAIQESFNSTLDEIPPDRQTSPSESGFGIFENMRGNAIREPIIRKFHDAEKRVTGIRNFPDAEQRIVAIDADKSRIMMELENRLYGPNKLPDPKKNGSERVISVQRDSDGLKVRLLGSHFYEPGQYRVRRSALQELSALAKILKEIGRPISIQGHTDSMQQAGEMSNWDLSSLRATNVLRYFVDEEGFSPTMISAGGYADKKPIAHNGTEAGRRLNRRIDILLRYSDE